MKNFYKILQVDREASPEVIHKAYRALVHQYHPDRYHTKQKQRMEEQMRAINEAYSILSDPTQRKRYDSGSFEQKASVPNQTASNTNMGSPLFRVLFWFLVTASILTLLRGAGRLLLVTPLGKILLLGGLAYLAIWYYKRKQR